MTRGGRKFICEVPRGGQLLTMQQAQQRAGAEWTHELIRFLQQQPGIAAVRVNTDNLTV